MLDVSYFLLQLLGITFQMQVPRDFLLQILGEDRVTKFVIQEIVSTTLGDYVKKASSFITFQHGLLMQTFLTPIYTTGKSNRKG